MPRSPSPDRRLLFTGSPCRQTTFGVMRPPLLHVSCSDLHPGCARHLWGHGAEDLVLAYVLHHQDEHVVAQVDLEHLLSSVTVWAPGLQGGPAGAGSRALSVAG